MVDDTKGCLELIIIIIIVIMCTRACVDSELDEPQNTQYIAESGEHIGKITSVRHVDQTEFGAAYTDIVVDKDAHFMVRGLISVVVGDTVYLVPGADGVKNSIKMDSFDKVVYIE